MSWRALHREDFAPQLFLKLRGAREPIAAKKIDRRRLRLRLSLPTIQAECPKRNVQRQLAGRLQARGRLNRDHVRIGDAPVAIGARDCHHMVIAEE